MSSGQSLRNGSSVEPGLPNTFLIPKARSRPKVASLTLRDFVLAGLRDDMSVIPGMSSAVIVRSDLSAVAQRAKAEATKRPPLLAGIHGLLRFARNDGGYHVAVPFMVGWPSAFAVHISMPPPALSLALIENSLPSNSGCMPR